MLDTRAAKSARRYNRARGYARFVWKQIQVLIGASPDGYPGFETARRLAAWQGFQGLDPDGKCGPETLNELATHLGWTEPRVLTFDEIDTIIYQTVLAESGGDPAAANLDSEYHGWHDNPKRDAKGAVLHPRVRAQRPGHRAHWASKYRVGHSGYHIGLSIGRAQWAQSTGTLGQGARMVYHANKEQFKRIMGASWKKVLDMLNAAWDGHTWDEDGRNPRVQKIDGFDMWEQPWLARWKELARTPEWAEVELTLAYRGYLKPLLPLLKSNGLTSAQHLSVWFDVANANGVGGCRSRLRKALRRTEARDPKSLIDAMFSSDESRERRYKIIQAVPPHITYTWEAAP